MSRIFSVGAGKGGVGKSFISANLGALLANQGHNVVLVDLDLGGANLHTFLGIKNPKTGLNKFLKKEVTELEDVVVPTVIPNLSIISSADCSMEIANLFHGQKIKIIKAIRKLPHDIVILDLGAGTNFNTLDFFLSSNQGLLILTPEPTSIENSVQFIKASCVRTFKQVLSQDTYNAILKEIVDNAAPPLLKVSELIGIVKKHDSDTGQYLEKRMANFQFHLILNQFHRQTDPTFGENFEKACNTHFYSKFRFLGSVGYDEGVHDSIFSRKIYISKYPYTPTVTDLKKIAKKIAGEDQGSVLQSSRMK